MFSCKLSVLFNNVCVFVFIWPLLMSVCVCVYMWIISTTKNYVGIKCIIFFLYFTLLLCFSFQRKSFVNEWVFVTCFFCLPTHHIARLHCFVCVCVCTCPCVHVCMCVSLSVVCKLRSMACELFQRKPPIVRGRAHTKTGQHTCEITTKPTRTHHRPAAHSLAKPNAVDAECVCVECVSLSICLAGRYVRRDPGGQL